MSSTESITCRYRLDDTTSSTIALPDGRKLGYAEYGNPNGHAIVNIPGFPSSRVEGTLLDEAATKVDARIISIDRPGFGWSTAHPSRTMQTFAQDVDALTKHLNLEKYAVLGISGGGPYALACARYLPSTHLRAVSLVCGLGSPDMTYTGMRWQHQLGWTYGQTLFFPPLLRWWFSRDPGARLDLPLDQRMTLMRRNFNREKSSMNDKDRSFFGDEDLMRMHLYRSSQVYAHGMSAMWLDFTTLNSDFGFKIEDIRKDLPVQLWYGDKDVFVPLQHGQKIAARLGTRENVRFHVKDETHATISHNWKEEYLGSLVEAIVAQPSLVD